MAQPHAPLGDLEWGPTIDAIACDGCRICVDFCHMGVFAFVDGKALVAQRNACVPGCSHCAGLCQRGAISFPSLEEIRRIRPRP